MTNYRLHDDLSFCRIDERPIFLDTRRDRYFRLPAIMENRFVAYIEGHNYFPEEIAKLVEIRILTDKPPASDDHPQSCPAASQSALESAPNTASPGFWTVAEVLVTIAWTQIQLKTRELRNLLNENANFRKRASQAECEHDQQRLLATCQAFLKARRFVPIETRCLLDSLSMTRYLARRRLYSNIVFGVTSDPFSAHCWVQAGQLVLNDTVGNTGTYTVIRVN